MTSDAPVARFLQEAVDLVGTYEALIGGIAEPDRDRANAIVGTIDCPFHVATVDLQVWTFTRADSETQTTETVVGLVPVPECDDHRDTLEGLWKTATFRAGGEWLPHRPD